MTTLFQDVRYAVRHMARTPGFTLAAVTTLALAIGANTAMFSIVHGVLLRPLSYKGSERLVRLSEEHPGGTPLMRDAVLSNLTFEAWSREPRTIDGLAAYAGRTYTVSILGESQRLSGAAVSPAMFDVLGVAPRGFYFPDRNAELWTPYVLPPAAKGNTSILRALANLRPGATLEQAVRGQAP